MVEQTLTAQVNAGASQPIVYPVANELRHLLVSGGLPANTEATRAGYRWKTMTATPFAPIVVVPTTLANLEIVNNTVGYNLVVDTIFIWQLLGTAAAWQITPWAQVGAAVYSGNTALVIYSGNGTTAVTSSATSFLKTAITQTVVAAGWEPFPGSTSSWGTAAATPGGANIGNVAGRLVVPFGKALHVAGTGSVATASSVNVGASGYLVPITNSAQ